MVKIGMIDHHWHHADASSVVDPVLRTVSFVGSPTVRSRVMNLLSSFAHTPRREDGFLGSFWDLQLNGRIMATTRTLCLDADVYSLGPIRHGSILVLFTVSAWMRLAAEPQSSVTSTRFQLVLFFGRFRLLFRHHCPWKILGSLPAQTTCKKQVLLG